MQNVREALPDDVRHLWDEMNNFNFLKDFKPSSELAEWKEHTFLPMMTSQTTQFAYEKWKPRVGDVFVVAFPKTGLHFGTQIVRKLLYCDDEDAMKFMSNVPVQLGCFEGGMPSKFKVWDNLPLKRRMVSTHLPASLMNVKNIKDQNAKVVYFLRNPKDQLVSWFHFIPKMPYRQMHGVKDKFPEDWESFYSAYTKGEMPMGMKKGEWYPDHILGWLKHKDDKNVIFVYYEDLIDNLRGEIERISSFLKVDRSKEVLDSIAEECTFKSMKNEEEAGTTASLKTRKQAGILRKGGYGGWREMFTEEQSNEIDRIFAKRLGSSDVSFKFE